MRQKNIVAKRRLSVTRNSVVVALILIGAVLLSNPSERFGGIVQASTPPSTALSQHYGGYYTDEKAYSVVQTSDGGYALAGTNYSYPYLPTGTHALLVKTDSSGNMQWNKNYAGGGNGEDYVRSVVQTSDGGYAFAGYTRASYPGYLSPWLVKTDSAGNLLWSKTYPAPVPWSIQTVDSSADVGSYSSLALDSSGNPHIAYYDFTNGQLKYAFWTGSTWSVQIVDSGHAGQETSIALDSSGYPHISYYDYDNSWLKYAFWTGSTWSVQIVDTGGVGHSSSLALDSSGYPHIAYWETGNYGRLRYAFWNGSAWSVQIVDFGNVGEYSSLALDSSGNPHISYYAYGTNEDLKYAYWNGSNWNIQTVDSLGRVGEFSSLALDSSGNPHISYNDYTNHCLKYASWSGSAWGLQVVDSSADVGLFSSLALDSSGNPHIAYYDNTNAQLKYAYWSGSGWNIQVADSSANVGEYSSLALDSSGNPHISYYDYTNMVLKYAWVTGSGVRNNYAYSMVQTSDGGYALAGEGGPSGSSYSYALLVKTDSAGNMMWTKFLGAVGSAAYSLVQTSDGGYALAGTRIWKTDSAGNLQWTEPLSDPEAVYAYSIIQTSDGGYAYAGDKNSLNVGYDIYLAKTDSSGNLQWNATYGGAKSDNCYSVVQTSDGGYALAGITQSYGAGDWDCYLIKTNSSGGLEWQTWYGSSMDDGAYCVIETSDGGLAVAGYSKSYTNGGYDMYLVKLSPSLPPPYSATVWAWDALDPNGWISEPITMDGVSTGFSTPHNFTNLGATHTFAVPSVDVDGNSFYNWTTGETSTTITVSSGGTYTAQYYETYNATIWAWENVSGWLAEPIQMDGDPSGYSTPHNFTGLSGTHTFAVPSTDVHGYSFKNWTTGETSTTITVSGDGTYTAQYYVTTPIPEFPVPLFLTVFTLVTLSAALCVKQARHPRLSRASRTRPSPT